MGRLGVTYLIMWTWTSLTAVFGAQPVARPIAATRARTNTVRELFLISCLQLQISCMKSCHVTSSTSHVPLTFLSVSVIGSTPAFPLCVISTLVIPMIFPFTVYDVPSSSCTELISMRSGQGLDTVLPGTFDVSCTNS